MTRSPSTSCASVRCSSTLTWTGRLRRRHFQRNEVIFHQGDPGDSLHVVNSGAVKIVLPSPEGMEAIIATLRPGDFFGELSLLDGAPRSATAVALEASETLALPRDAFRELLDQDTGLRDALLVGLAHELRRVTGQVEELDWPYTQSDLASMIGGTRQSVNKLLSELVYAGLVRIERDTLVIPSVAALERQADR